VEWKLVDWYIMVCSVIVVCATAGLVAGKIDAKDFVTCVGLVLSFLSGRFSYVFERRLRGK